MNHEQPAAPAPTTTYVPRTLVVLAATFVLLAGMWWARGFIGPVVLAAIIVIIVHPLRFGLERRGWRPGAATTVVVVSGWLVVAVIAALVVFAIAQFATMVADYGPELRAAIADVQGWLASVGLDSAASDAAAQALDPARLVVVVTSVGSSAMTVVGTLFLVFTYVLFMAADGSRYATASAVFGAERAGAIARAEQYTRGVRRYYVVSASFGAVVAVIDGLALWALGIPAPVVWAILAFVTNFIPNIGFVLGLIPPAVLALVVGGWPLMLGVVAIYCVVNVVLQVLVQPKVVSDAVDLSLTLSFASVTFWTFVIGPLGAILSIPLTLLVRAVLLEPDASTGWLRWLSGDRTARPAVGPGAGPASEPASVGPGGAAPSPGATPV